MKRIDKSNEKRKSRNTNNFAFELRERQEDYTVKVIPIAIGCLGGGMKELKIDMQKIFEHEKRKRMLYDNERNAKDCALGKQIHDLKGFIGTVDMR